MKWNCSRSCTPRDLSSSTTLARLVLWISGTVVVRSSFFVSTLCVESAREKPMTGLHLPCAGLPASHMD